MLGEIPFPLEGCTKLEVVDLSWNNLEGNLWGAIFKWIDLSVLNPGHNYLQVPLPDWIIGFQSLHMLELSNNNFSGSIPQDVHLHADQEIEHLGENKGKLFRNCDCRIEFQPT